MACIHPLQAAATSVRDPCARCSTMFLRLHQLLQCPRRPTPTEGGAAPSVAGAGAGAVQPDPGPASAPTPRGHRPPPLPPSRTLRQEILAAAGLPAEARIVWHFSWDFSGQPLVAAVVPICYLRPGHDVVCLPRHRAVEHFWAWAAPLYGYLPWQAVWYTPGPELRVHRQVLDAVQALASPARVELPPRQPRRGPLRTAPDRPRGCWPHPKEDGRAAPEHTAAVGGQPPAVGVTDATRGVGGWRPNRRAGPRAALLIVPLQRTEALTRAAGARGLPVFGDCTWGAARVPDKGRLHSPPGDGPRSVPDGYLRHPVTHQLTDVRVPKGFRCRTKRELREAYAALTQAGLAVVLKPSWGNGSHGIEREVSQQRILEYTWDYSEGSVVLEEMLKIDRHPDGSHIMPIFVLVGKSLCGGVAEQFLRKGGGYHGSVSHRLPQPLVDRLTGECHKLAEIFQFEGFWGVDFLVQEGEPFLVDLNSGRYCGAHGAKLYTELHAPGRPFKYFFEELPPDGPDAATLTRRLRAHQLEFTAASGHGVAVLLALPGVGGEDGRFLAVGWDMADLQRISDAFQAHCGDILAPA